MAEGGAQVDLILTVTQGPLVTVRFDPPDAIPPKLQGDLVPVAREGSADQDLLEDSEIRIRDYLRGQGYRDAKVTPARTEANGVLTIVFRLARGALYRVAGVTVVSDVRVQRSGDSGRSCARWRASPSCKATLDADVAAVTAEYRSRGFANATVTAGRRPRARRRNGRRDPGDGHPDRRRGPEHHGVGA